MAINQADVVLKDKNGQDALYSDVETVSLPSAYGGTDEVFTAGQPLDGMAVTLDFSGGDMAVNVPTGFVARSVAIGKPSTLQPQNIADGVNIAGIVGTMQGGGGGGAWWNPTGGDYSWTRVYLNKFSGAKWNSILPLLDYNESYDCVIANFYTAENVRGIGLEQLVASDIYSDGQGQGYALFYARTYDAGTPEEWTDWEPIYATANIVTPRYIWGDVAAGFNTDAFNISYNDENGCLVPVIDEPIAGSLTAWNDLWAGDEIAFGHFIGADAESRAQDIIDNNVSYLDANDFWQWLRSPGYNPNPRVRPYFFKGNSLLETVEFHPFVSTIGDSAFEDCTALTSVGWLYRRNGIYMIRSIGAKAFYGCTSLSAADINGGVYFNSIGDYVFANCPNLRNVTIRNTNLPPMLGVGVFDTTSLEHIYVPASAVYNYRTAAGWSAYASYIEAIPN